MQTLTALYLQRNGIDAEGVQYLAEALQNNTVRRIFFSSALYLPLFYNTDAYHAQSGEQLHPC